MIKKNGAHERPIRVPIRFAEDEEEHESEMRKRHRKKKEAALANAPPPSDAPVGDSPETDGNAGGVGETHRGSGAASIVDVAEPTAPSATAPEDVAATSTVDSDDPTVLRHRLEESLKREKRWLADLDNYRRRTERMFEEQAETRKRALASDLLEIVDDFDRALEHADETDSATGFGEGVGAMREKLLAILARHGFMPFRPLHEPFDPNTQDALGTLQHPELENGTVAYVLRTGWKAGERLLRPAQVMVVKNS